MSSRHVTYLFVLLLAASLAACTEEVAAPEGVEEPFSMYGILNPRLNTQTMLVSPTHHLLDDYPEEIDAVVRSTDLETGETVVWRDSVVRGERGQIDHVFVADFRARFGAPYRVEVVRGDGAGSSAEAWVPDVVDVTWQNLAPNFMDVYVHGEGFHLLAAVVAYRVKWYERFGDPDPRVNPCEFPTGTYAFTHRDKIVETDGGYRIRINLDFDHERVLAGYLLDYSGDYLLEWKPNRVGLALMDMEIRLVIAEPAWAPPGGDFTWNVLAQPNIMSNVTNGFGFVGGGYNQDRRIVPGSSIVDETWFFDFIMRHSDECLDYCACGLG